MSVRAKFRCYGVGTDGDTSDISLLPVMGGSAENESFFKYTPGGQINLAVVNPEAAAQFEVGQEYYVDFTKAE